MNEAKAKAKREQFFKALLSLNTIEEYIVFFDDIATMRELEAFIQRFEVAQRVLNGETYEMIELETNARSSLVSRIKRCVEGEQSGIRKILERLNKAEGMKSR